MMYDQTRAQQPAGQPRDSAERRRPGPEPLVPSDEQDKIVRHLQHAINTFADTPLKALEEAESAYDEAISQLVNALAERRSLLRAGWQDQDPEAQPAASDAPQSDELRLALRQYREITQRLLRL
jgi:ABC-type transporter Mla subunit MlaD